MTKIVINEKVSNKGFASHAVGKDGLTGRERAKTAGSAGGKKSRRGPASDYLRLCKSCWCMTKTYAGRCTKCGAPRFGDNA